VVWNLAQDREGTIWAATDSGLLRLEGSQWKEVGKDWNFPGRLAAAIFLDHQGTLWVSTENTLVFLPPGARSFHLTGIPVGQVTQIAHAANGKLWMAETSRSVRPIPLSDNRQPSDEAEVRVGSGAILFDNDGSLWIATLGDGLRRAPAPELLKGGIQEFSTAVESLTAKEGLSDDYVRTILRDREGNIWIGTNSGLDRFRKTNLVPLTLPFKPTYGVLAPGDDGDAWVENLHSMVHVHGGRADPARPILTQALSAYRDPAGTIWWLGIDAIYRYDAGNYMRFPLPPSFPKSYIQTGIAATEDGSGGLWLAALSEGLFYWKDAEWRTLESASEFAKLRPIAAFTDWKGQAWFGYAGGTILILDHEKIQRVFPADASPVGSVRAIQGRGRHIWVGGDSGLAFFDGNRFELIGPQDTETFGPVIGIEETADGSLWLAEGRGIVQVPASEVKQALDNPSYRVKYRLFDSFDGLPGKIAATGAYLKEIQGTTGGLWFLASGGVVWVDPANISTNTLPPPVLIRSVKANGRQVSSLTNLSLPPRTTDLQISYTALSLSAPEKVRFRYRLDGVDKNWQDAGTRREAFYTRLGPGNYHFRVIACNNDGIWNEEGAHLDFAIAAAWYQTIWFRGLCVLAFFTLFWAAYQMRVHQLQEQEQKFRDAVETMPALAFVADPDGNRTFFNKGWLEYTGLRSEQASGSGWQMAVHPDDLKRVTERWSESRTTGEPLEYEARLRRGSDGVYRWFQTRARPLRDSRGKIVKWCAAATDIQDRKRVEELQAELAHTNRVSVLGELAASISHELKQPIAAAMANAQASLRWLNRDQPDLEGARRSAEAIMKDEARASDIIDRLRSLYKKTPPRREAVDLNEIIAEMVLLMRGEADGYAVSIRTELATDLPRITADRVQLQQVLMNLMLNGIEAMKEAGGALRIETERGDGGQVLISVSDTGAGFPAGKADEIFKAFFTTKPEGSGMGLAISRSIVESHGGSIWATGEDGCGATFHFTLPLAC
jgi:PAS domain S-box-containing protein